MGGAPARPREQGEKHDWGALPLFTSWASALWLRRACGSSQVKGMPTGRHAVHKLQAGDEVPVCGTSKDPAKMEISRMALVHARLCSVQRRRMQLACAVHPAHHAPCAARRQVGDTATCAHAQEATAGVLRRASRARVGARCHEHWMPEARAASLRTEVASHEGGRRVTERRSVRESEVVVIAWSCDTQHDTKHKRERITSPISAAPG